MARIRKQKQQKQHCNIGVYIRISKEDGNEQSLSVINQKKIILEYLENNFREEYKIVDIYIDDGITGTDYYRPEFQRMIQDMEKGNINCIICKNLSRMFRNYSDQGYFLEKVFPFHGVRFITISEPKIDSFLYPDVLNGLEIPINGLMNDRFAAKTSRDIRDTFDTKRRKGEFIGAFAPYGYQKDVKDKNKLVIDEQVADIVKNIYKWFVYDGMSKQGIAKYLNEQGVLNPSAYKRNKGFHYYNPKKEMCDIYWSASTVSAILKNEVYIGTMVQGKQKVISYKVHNVVSVPEKDWYIVPHTHQAIIEKELFQKAQHLQLRDTRVAPKNKKVHILAGLIYCADCKRAMTRQKTKQNVYYYCRTYKEKSKSLCTKHSIKEQMILKIVLTVLQKQISLFCNIDEIVEVIATTEKYNTMYTQNIIEIKKKDIQKYNYAIDILYEDWKKKYIDFEQYNRLKLKYEMQIKQMEQSIQNALKNSSTVQKEIEKQKQYKKTFLKYQNITNLNRGILVELIKKILIYENNKIEIVFCFTNPYITKVE
ncbi:recombinase family protein [Clostridium sp. MD294]|uniref:recombinase family protein n=1 Tax=Clostridium sp. MD294 TaxID=97138 RepID=UPI0002C9750C|nr:recombinase family protein [Clostridium sp. MD294]NDO46333.1 recombinase family protein [Clostridium sp. MD294]USF29240.1 hypothetical protein C820_000625 [Clostridium sp. MD294]